MNNKCSVCDGDLDFDVGQDELEVESSPCICTDDPPPLGIQIRDGVGTTTKVGG